MGQIAARQHELRPGSLDEGSERPLDVRILTGARMEIGHVQDACAHGRSRL